MSNIETTKENIMDANDNNKMRHQLEMLNKKYDALTMSMQRQKYISHSEKAVQENDEIVQYIRKGSGNKGWNLKSEAMRFVGEGDNVSHSFGEMSKNIINTMHVLSPLRSLCSTEQISSGHLEVIKQGGKFACHWGEKGFQNATASPNINVMKIYLHDLYACPKASQNLLDDVNIDIKGWLEEQLAQSFSEAENQAFFSYKEKVGEDQPESLLRQFEELTYKDANEVEHEKENQYVIEKKKVEGTESKEFDLDSSDIIGLKAKLESKYQSKAVFLMHPDTLNNIRYKKDVHGNYIVRPAYTESENDTLFGIKVVCSQDMISIHDKSEKKTKPVILYGDFNSAYKIVEHQNIPFVKDIYMYKPYVGFYARKRVGGKVLEEKAICALIAKED